jgi:hypothetical protein
MSIESDPDHNLIEAWVATLDDDTEMTMADHKTFDAVPADRCKAITVRLRGRSDELHASCVPANGDRMRMFMRRAIKFGPNALSTAGRTLNMPVIEIVNAGAPGFVRMYAHPRHGVIVSTLNLEL